MNDDPQDADSAVGKLLIAHTSILAAQANALLEVGIQLGHIRGALLNLTTGQNKEANRIALEDLNMSRVLAAMQEMVDTIKQMGTGSEGG